MWSENREVGLPWQMAFMCCKPLLLDIKRSQNVTRAFMTWHITSAVTHFPHKCVLHMTDMKWSPSKGWEWPCSHSSDVFLPSAWTQLTVFHANMLHKPGQTDNPELPCTLEVSTQSTCIPFCPHTPSCSMLRHTADFSDSMLKTSHLKGISSSAPWLSRTDTLVIWLPKACYD